MKIFSTGKKVVVGMVHLLPLPGSPGFSGSRRDILRRALRDAALLEKGGVDGVMVENFGDVPFFTDSVPPETIAEMSVIAAELRRSLSIPLGINVLRNDAYSSLSIAAAVGADFIRVNIHSGAAVTDQGVIQGQAARTLRRRRELNAEVLIWADVKVKHSALIGEVPLRQLAQDIAYRGLADGLIVTGSGTGELTSLEELKAVRAAVPDRPLLVGSGVTADNVRDYLTYADGVIVGTSIKEKGIAVNPVSARKLSGLIKRVREKT